MRVAKSGAKRIAQLYKDASDGLKLFRDDLLKICGIETINEEIEFCLNIALRKLKLELMKFKGYYLVISLK